MTNLPINEIIQGDCLETMKQWPDECVDMCVTSPPYFGLRDYKADGQIGLEETPEQYVEKLVAVFREVRRVLKKDGTCWVNLGDSYNGSGKASGRTWEDGKVPNMSTKQNSNNGSIISGKTNIAGLKPKDLLGIPWMVAFALRADGWYLRQDIIWNKPNPMPESMTDRCTKAHEYIFLLSKNQSYYYDHETIKEPSVDYESLKGRSFRGRTSIYEEGAMPAKKCGKNSRIFQDRDPNHPEDRKDAENKTYPTKNKRSVWTVTVNKPIKAAHFAMYPLELIRPCIKAGCPKWVCPKCGKARRRIVEKTPVPKDCYTDTSKPSEISAVGNHAVGFGQKYQDFMNENPPKTIGWSDCGCNAGFNGGIVLDPFMGGGTSATVATQEGCNFIGCEINPDNIEIAYNWLIDICNKMLV